MQTDNERMARPAIHIGFQKTATLWFQTAVYPRVASHWLIGWGLVRSIFMDSNAFHLDIADARRGLKLDTAGSK
jgi:hypothetical protein